MNNYTLEEGGARGWGIFVWNKEGLSDGFRTVSVDELVRDAMERRLRERRRQSLYAYGEAQARKLGITEEDVDRIIHEFREEAGVFNAASQNKSGQFGSQVSELARKINHSHSYQKL